LRPAIFEALARDDFVQATGGENGLSLRRPQKWHRIYLSLTVGARMSNTAEAVLEELI
jgi:hypothetical protein